ncbi:MAG: hypothetical protein A3F35_00640 [Candidatus Woykebacteria bacterium RIFCSPHIGHO2_12_FULL_45_10]|uniref:DUF2061 domain-containing protein n=1 Tax=Candidatus Woykebacteria bacterium RIFCSPHIGHO2_12_FULL_45_10 TaxID=1802603 RepID=A0A1G1WQY1_9BACT|nr:MAG: hypothetical protein A3F35_00640 [Candidatus Woykebacteria bacterium RIFCSPHIGHO2_12_FULL_45_10]
MAAFHESKTRSLLKSITFWFIVILTDLGIIYLITRNVSKTIAAVVITNLVAALAYFVHERAWTKVVFGIRPHQPTDTN